VFVVVSLSLDDPPNPPTGLASIRAIIISKISMGKG
jgi:hypothetical protein